MNSHSTRDTIRRCPSALSQGWSRATRRHTASSSAAVSGFRTYFARSAVGASGGQPENVRAPPLFSRGFISAFAFSKARENGQVYGCDQPLDRRLLTTKIGGFLNRCTLVWSILLSVQIVPDSPKVRLFV